MKEREREREKERLTPEINMEGKRSEIVSIYPDMMAWIKEARYEHLTTFGTIECCHVCI